MRRRGSRNKRRRRRGSRSRRRERRDSSTRRRGWRDFFRFRSNRRGRRDSSRRRRRGRGKSVFRATHIVPQTHKGVSVSSLYSLYGAPELGLGERARASRPSPPAASLACLSCSLRAPVNKFKWRLEEEFIVEILTRASHQSGTRHESLFGLLLRVQERRPVLLLLPQLQERQTLRADAIHISRNCDTGDVKNSCLHPISFVLVIFMLAAKM
mmetsp:Transcript_23095/g.58382  ORF Transcript_23095/g.58382 Transcript_23095/m.58382 type:complete len:212 (+) Transcript_23095:347-982(+)